MTAAAAMIDSGFANLFAEKLCFSEYLLELGVGSPFVGAGRTSALSVVWICWRVRDSLSKYPVATAPGSDRIAVAGSLAGAGPYSSSDPSSRQNIIELSYSRPHCGQL